jgi:hypothetical protein
MSGEKRPLPAAVSEYMNDRHAATPNEVMKAVDLDEQYREQVEYYCAVTRYFMFGGDEGCEIPSSGHVENCLQTALPTYAEFLARHDDAFPFYCFISLVGARGMAVGSMRHQWPLQIR